MSPQTGNTIYVMMMMTLLLTTVPLVHCATVVMLASTAGHPSMQTRPPPDVLYALLLRGGLYKQSTHLLFLVGISQHLV